MRYTLLLLTLAAVLSACGDSTGPGGTLYPEYTLSHVDGQPLPTQAGLPDGYLLLTRSLRFMPSVDGWDAGGQHGEVRITSQLRLPDESIQVDQSLHAYQVSDRRLIIDLCPIGSACIAIVPADLSGALRDGVLLLTESIGGQARRVYLYAPILPE